MKAVNTLAIQIGQGFPVPESNAIRLNLWDSHPVGFLLHADCREKEVGMDGQTVFF